MENKIEIIMVFRIIKKSITSKLLWAAILLLSNITLAGEVLYNGIVLPSQWPPNIRHYSREPMCVPYLLSLPEIVPIDVGRQLFVDDFLIEETTLKRTFYSAVIHPASPVLVPEHPWEKVQKVEGMHPPMAMPFSDGVWYDQKDNIFKMWYMGGYLYSTCYATSEDGLVWQKPKLDVVEGTNIVQTDPRDSSTVWIDYNAKSPDQRYLFVKMNMDSFRNELHYSADGIHWSDIMAGGGSSGDRSTFFYNPFRQKWVFGLRCQKWSANRNETVSRELGTGKLPRMRRYAEGDTLAETLHSWPYIPNEPVTVLSVVFNQTATICEK